MDVERSRRRDGRRVLLLGAVCGTLAILVFVVGYWIRPHALKTLPAAPMETLAADRACDPGARTCPAIEGNRRLSLRFGSPIVPLKLFSVNVNLEGMAADTVIIEFRMEGMDMGMNRFDLMPAGGGVWRGEAILPICWMGRRQWTATVSALSGDVTMRVTFSFAVVS